MGFINKNQNKSWDQNFNLLIFFLAFFAVAANIWLVIQDIKTGIIYTALWTGFAVFWVLIDQLTKGQNFPMLNKYLRAPFQVSTRDAVLAFLVGLGVPALIQGVLKLIGSTFSITSFSIPLYASQTLGGITQSFSQAEIGGSMTWKIFNLALNAGISEEIIFTFGMVLFGAFVGLFLGLLIFKESSKVREGFVLTVAFAVATFLFTFLHTLNATYATIAMFAAAAIFKLVSIISVYLFGLALTFWIGYHISNNFMYLVEIEGGAAVLNGMTNVFGISVVVILALMVFYVIRNGKSQ